MSNYEVAMEAAWLVRDVKETDDAIGVAVSEAGKRLNETDKQYVEVEPGVTGCPACGEPFDAAFLAANTALVGLLLRSTSSTPTARSTPSGSRRARSAVPSATFRLRSSKSSKPTGTRTATATTSRISRAVRRRDRFDRRCDIGRRRNLF